MKLLERVFGSSLNKTIITQVDSFKPLSGYYNPYIKYDGHSVMTCHTTIHAVVNKVTIIAEAKFGYSVRKGYEYTPSELVAVHKFKVLEAFKPNNKRTEVILSDEAEIDILAEFIKYLRVADYLEYSEDLQGWYTY